MFTADVQQYIGSGTAVPLCPPVTYAFYLDIIIQTVILYTNQTGTYWP